MIIWEGKRQYGKEKWVVYVGKPPIVMRSYHISGIRNRSNIGDLIAYIECNNFQVVHSEIYSVFDLIYRQYTDARIKYLFGHPSLPYLSKGYGWNNVRKSKLYEEANINNNNSHNLHIIHE